MSDLSLRTMRALEAHVLHLRSRAGADEAIQIFRSLWRPDGECFTCGGSLGERTSTLLLPDPEDRTKTTTMLAPTCAKCASAPRRAARASWCAE